MSQYPLHLFLAELGPLLLGAGIVRWGGLGSGGDRLGFLAWSWIAGSLISSACMLVLLACGAPPPRTPLFASVLGLGGVLLLSVPRNAPAARLGVRPSSAGTVERLLFALVLGFLCFVTLERILIGSLTPVFTDDEAHQWALKAKLMWHFDGLGAGFAEAMRSWPNLHNADYPPLNPLQQLQVFAAEGGIVHVANRLPIQIHSLALLLLSASALRRLVRPGIAALLLLLVAACDETIRQAQQANGDLMVALGAVAACDAWLRWRATGERAWFRLFALALAFALWSKNEGQLLVVAIACAWAVSVLLARGPWRERVKLEPVHAWLLVPLGFHLAQRIFNAHFGLESGWLANPEAEKPIATLLREQFSERVLQVLAYFRDHILLEPRHGGLAFAAMLALLCVSPRRLGRGPVGAIALALFIALAGFVLVFLGAPHRLDWHLENAAGRVTFQLVPVAVVWLACAWRELAGSADRSQR